MNAHLPQHARNFGTLVNTAVGVKEMVYRTFKNAVPHSNRKIIELDLIRRYNTTQALRHIIDGWKDPRFNIDTNAFDDLITDPKLRTILSGWYVTESSSIFIDNQEFEDESDGKILLSIIDR